jgi:hypothetical protein
MHVGPVHQRPRCGRSIQSLDPMLKSLAIALTAVCCAAFFITMLVGLIIDLRLSRILRERHPETWIRLNPPKADGRPIAARFVYHRQYLEIPDLQVHRLGNLTRRFTVAACIEGGALMLLGAVALALTP